MTYLTVFDGDAFGWHLSRAAILSALSRDWPDLEPRLGESDVRDVSWALPAVDGAYEAYMSEDGTCLYVEGDLSSAVSLAVWCRKLIPERIEVVFCNESYDFSAVVSSAMSAETLFSIVEGQVS